jgi:hypothetical protein
MSVQPTFPRLARTEYRIAVRRLHLAGGSLREQIAES